MPPSGGPIPIPLPARPPILPIFVTDHYPSVSYQSQPQPEQGSPADPTNAPSAPQNQPSQGYPSPEGDENATCVHYPVPGATSTGGQSVDLEISFGHFPSWKGMPGGKLMLYAVGTHHSLANGTLLQFDHISQRRIGVVIPSTSDNPIGTNKVALVTQMGQLRYYDFSNSPVGTPFGGSEIYSERLRLLNSDYTLCYGNVEDATFFEETFMDGSIIHYRADDGTPYAYCTHQGVWVQVEELGGDLRVVRQTLDGKCAYYDNKLDSMRHANNIQDDRIRQIWCRMDGLLDCPDAHTINWYAPSDTLAMVDENGLFPIREGATPVKTWNLTAIAGMAESGDDPSTNSLSMFKMRAMGNGAFEESRWQPYGKDGTYFISGSGQQAACSVKVRKALESDVAPVTRPNGLALKIGQSPVSAIRETTYTFRGERSLDGINLDTADFVESVTHEDYRSYPFGDVIVKRTKSYGQGADQVWTYSYETDTTSPNYGRMIRQTTPEGNWTEYDYDDEGRVVKERTLWDDAVSVLETRTTFADLWYNDYRTACVEKWVLAPDGTETMLLKTESQYEESDLLIRETVTETALGSEYPRISITETHGDSAECPFARGRLKRTLSYDGAETSYDYSATDEEGASWAATSTRVRQGVVVPGQSTRFVTLYDASGYAFITREQVHDGTDFVTVSESRSSADVSGRTIATVDSEGSTTATDWSCCGPKRETHDNGTQSWYEYDSAKRLIREVHEAPAPLPEILEHVSISRQPDTIITHEYDGLGREIATVTAIGSCSVRTEKTYDSQGNLASTTDAAGLVTRYEYSDNNLMQSVTHPSGQLAVSRRNAAGIVIEESATGQPARFYSRRISPEGIVETVRQDSPNGPILAESVSDGFGRTVSNGIPAGDQSSGLVIERLRYDAQGRNISRVSENKAPQIMEYDAFGNMVRSITKISPSSEVEPSVDRVTEYETVYTGMNPAPAILPAGLASGVFRKSVTSAILPGGSRANQESYTRLMGQEKTSVSLTKNKYGCWSASVTENKQGNTITTMWQDGVSAPAKQYTVGGDIVLSISPSGDITTSVRSYTNSGTCLYQTDARGNTLTMVHDKAGRIVTSRDADGKTTSYSYDPVTGLLACTTDAMGGEIHYRYNAAGQLTEQFGSGTQPIRKDYDSNGRMIALTTWRNPGETLTGIPDTPGDTTQWEYDSLSGLPVKKTYADGTSETTVYNRDRLVIRTVRADGSSIGYIYQAETWELAETSFSDQSTPICHSYDALGRLASITDGTGTRTYSYNHVGDLVREEFEGSVRSILEYKFDACGRDAGYTLSVDGVNVQDTALTYDSFGRLQTASSEEGKVFTWHYGEGELLTGMDWPNGMRKELQYEDRRNAISALVYKDASGREVLAHRYGYDALGRPTLLTDHAGGREERRIVPNYNPRSELIAAAYDGKEDYTYTYDNIGNRVQSRELAVSRSYTSNRLNQYVRIEQQNAGNAFTPEFDVHGNQTRIQTRTGVWDVLYDMRNRPEQFAGDGHSVVCSYDFMGRRTDRLEYHGNTLTSREHFIYKGYVQIAAYKLDAEGQFGDCFVLTKSCYWDPSQPTATRILAMKDASDATMLYAACDTVKNITALYDDAGTCRARYVYSPYGEKLIEEGDKHTANAFGFSSEYDDTPLGLYYYNYRYFNPLESKWISRDLIQDINVYNVYAYVNNMFFIANDGIGLACFVISRLKDKSEVNDIEQIISKYKKDLDDLEAKVRNGKLLLSNGGKVLTRISFIAEVPYLGGYKNKRIEKKVTTINDVLSIIKHEKDSFLENKWDDYPGNLFLDILKSSLFLTEEYDMLTVIAHGYSLNILAGPSTCIIGPHTEIEHSKIIEYLAAASKSSKKRTYFVSCFQDGSCIDSPYMKRGKIMTMEKNGTDEICFINIVPPVVRKK